MAKLRSMDLSGTVWDMLVQLAAHSGNVIVIADAPKTPDFVHIPGTIVLFPPSPVVYEPYNEAEDQAEDAYDNDYWED